MYFGLFEFGLWPKMVHKVIPNAISAKAKTDIQVDPIYQHWCPTHLQDWSSLIFSMNPWNENPKERFKSSFNLSKQFSALPRLQVNLIGQYDLRPDGGNAIGRAVLHGKNDLGGVSSPNHIGYQLCCWLLPRRRLRLLFLALFCRDIGSTLGAVPDAVRTFEAEVPRSSFFGGFSHWMASNLESGNFLTHAFHHLVDGLELAIVENLVASEERSLWHPFITNGGTQWFFKYHIWTWK